MNVHNICLQRGHNFNKLATHAVTYWRRTGDKQYTSLTDAKVRNSNNGLIINCRPSHNGGWYEESSVGRQSTKDPLQSWRKEVVFCRPSARSLPSRRSNRAQVESNLTQPASRSSSSSNTSVITVTVTDGNFRADPLTMIPYDRQRLSLHKDFEPAGADASAWRQKTSAWSVQRTLMHDGYVYCRELMPMTKFIMRHRDIWEPWYVKYKRTGKPVMTADISSQALLHCQTATRREV